MTNNLGAPRIADGQASGQWASSNDGDGALDAALTASLSVEVDNTNTVTLTAPQFVGNVNFTLVAAATPPSGAVTVNVPATHPDTSALARGNFNIINSLAQDATVQVSGQLATAPVVVAGTSAALTMDGSNVRSVATATAAAHVLSSHSDVTLSSPSDGQVLTFDSATGKWVNEASSGGAGSGKIAQVVNTQTGIEVTGTTTIPADGTTPQNTEGVEMMTLAITPTNAASMLVVEVVTMLDNTDGNTWLITALFKDLDASAMAVAAVKANGAQNSSVIPLRWAMTAGGTSEITFKVRCGGNNAGTIRLNRALFGIGGSAITITEVLP